MLLAHTIRQATEVARSHDQIASRPALLAAGVGSDAIKGLVEIGHLHRVLPGIYLAGADRLSHRQLQRVAVLVAPGRTWLSARSSLELRDVLWPRTGQVTIYSTARIAHDELWPALPLEGGAVGRISLCKLVRRPPSEQVEGLPATKVPRALNGRRYIADFYWIDLGLVLELDSPDHLKPAAGARDRVRDTDFFVAGIDVVRFLDLEVVAEPQAYIRRLEAILARQRARN